MFPKITEIFSNLCKNVNQYANIKGSIFYLAVCKDRKIRLL